MALSSQGVGSGLDVNSIVTQLVAIEKQSLKPLQTSAAKLQTQLSLYGKVKSQASTLGDMAATLGNSLAWSAQKGTSSNPGAVGVTVASGASTSTLSVEVANLARSQSAASTGVAAGTAVGASGTLTFQLGSWAGASPSVLGFTAGLSTPKDVTIDADDTTSDIAVKINAANAGVTATVLRDGTNERLVIRSNSTGLAGGFSITSADAGLAQFQVTGTIDSTNAAPAAGMFMSQLAADASVKVNGVTVTSASNTMTDVVPGVTLQLSQVTSTPVEVVVDNDLATAKQNIQSFVDAYNVLNTTLSDATKYDASSKSGGPLQGDATTVGLQMALRSMMGSSSSGSAAFTRLSEIGLERQTDGSLKINTTKLTSALGNLDALKALFVTNNNDTASNGFGLKVRDFARGLVAVDGRVSNKATALQGSITRNSADQDRVNERAARVEAALRRQYSALDKQMATLNGLSSYVNAQLAQWNKSTA